MNFRQLPRKMLIILVLPILIGSGCAYKRMIFNKLDWLVIYQLDSYLDLSDAQEKSIKPTIQETVNWLKSERLPAITDLLRDVQKAAEARRIDVKTYEGWLKRIDVWRLEVTERVTPSLAILLKDLNGDQIKHLEEKLQKGDVKLVKLLERSDSEFAEELEDYVDEAAGSYKFWFGKLRKDQKALLVEKLGWNRASFTEHVKQRRRSQDFWIELMKRRNRDQLATALLQSAQVEGSFRDPDYLRFRQERGEKAQNFMLALFASLDQQQWQHFDKVIGELVLDLESLSATQRSPS